MVISVLNYVFGSSFFLYFSKNLDTKSIGIGKMIVEFFSAEIVFKV